MITIPAPRRRRTPARFARVAPACAAFAVLAGSGLALAGPAAAESYTHRDASHDVVGYSGSGKKPAPAPREGSVDVTRLAVSYGEQALTYVVHVRGPLPKSDLSAVGTFRLPSGEMWSAQVDEKPKGLKTTLYGPDYVQPCSGFTADLADRRTVLTLSVPTSCFPDAASVRTGFGVLSGIKQFVKSQGKRGTAYLDDAQRRGYGNQNDPKLGPSLARG